MNSKPSTPTTMTMSNIALKSVIHCEYCECIYESPIILPCGETICEKDLVKMLNPNDNTKIDCKLCMREHKIGENGLPKNKKLIKLLETTTMATINLNAKPNYSTAVSSLDRLKSLINDLDSLNVDPLNYINDYFNKLHNELVSTKDQLTTRINEIFQIKQNQIESIRDECCNETNNNKKTNSLKQNRLESLDQAKIKLNDLLKELNNLTSEDQDDESPVLIRINKEANLLNDFYNDQLKTIQNGLLLNKSYQFKSKHIQLDENSFGELIISNKPTDLSSNEEKIKDLDDEPKQIEKKHHFFNPFNPSSFDLLDIHHPHSNPHLHNDLTKSTSFGSNKISQLNNDEIYFNNDEKKLNRSDSNSFNNLDDDHFKTSIFNPFVPPAFDFVNLTLMDGAQKEDN